MHDMSKPANAGAGGLSKGVLLGGEHPEATAHIEHLQSRQSLARQYARLAARNAEAARLHTGHMAHWFGQRASLCAQRARQLGSVR